MLPYPQNNYFMLNALDLSLCYLNIAYCGNAYPDFEYEQHATFF